MRSKTDGTLIGDAASGIWGWHCDDAVDRKEQEQKEQQRLLLFDGKFIP